MARGLTLKKYIEKLQEIADEYGAERIVIAAADGEGNDFQLLERDSFWSVGRFYPRAMGDERFYQEPDPDEPPEEQDEEDKPPAGGKPCICIWPS